MSGMDLESELLCCRSSIERPKLLYRLANRPLLTVNIYFHPLHCQFDIPNDLSHQLSLLLGLRPSTQFHVSTGYLP